MHIMQNATSRVAASVVGAAEPEELGGREAKRERTYRRMEKAAVELALQYGSEHVTVEQICAASEVSARTFFNYFGSKEAALIGRGKRTPTPELREAFINADGPLLSDLLRLITRVGFREPAGHRPHPQPPPPLRERAGARDSKFCAHRWGARRVHGYCARTHSSQRADAVGPRCRRRRARRDRRAHGRDARRGQPLARVRRHRRHRSPDRPSTSSPQANHLATKSPKTWAAIRPTARSNNVTLTQGGSGA